MAAPITAKTKIDATIEQAQAYSATLTQCTKKYSFCKQQLGSQKDALISLQSKEFTAQTPYVTDNAAVFGTALVAGLIFGWATRK